MKKTYEYDGEEVYPVLASYSVEDFMGEEKSGLALLLFQGDEEYTCLTVSFGEFLGAKNCAFIDTNNNRNAISWLEENGFGKVTSMTKRSGFCEYPLFYFEEAVLKEIDSVWYEEYAAQYDME